MVTEYFFVTRYFIDLLCRVEAVSNSYQNCSSLYYTHNIQLVLLRFAQKLLEFVESAFFLLSFYHVVRTRTYVRLREIQQLTPLPVCCMLAWRYFVSVIFNLRITVLLFLIWFRFLKNTFIFLYLVITESKKRSRGNTFKNWHGFYAFFCPSIWIATLSCL